MDNDIEKFNNITQLFNELNTKIALYSLINQAKDEYEKCNYESGRNYLNKALSLSKNNPAILRGLGCIEQFDGNLEKALEYFLLALKYSDKKEVEYTLIGMLYYLMNDYELSLKYFNLAINQNDSYDTAYEGRNQAMLEYHLKIIDIQESLNKIFNK